MKSTINVLTDTKYARQHKRKNKKKKYFQTLIELGNVKKNSKPNNITIILFLLYDKAYTSFLMGINGGRESSWKIESIKVCVVLLA